MKHFYKRWLRLAESALLVITLTGCGEDDRMIALSLTPLHALEGVTGSTSVINQLTPAVYAPSMPSMIPPVVGQWMLSSTSYGETYVNQPFVGNGYMGLGIPSAGQGYWLGTKTPDNRSSWPLYSPRYTSALIGGYYGDASIVGLPNWSSLTIRDSTDSYDPLTIQASQLSGYSQSTDMQNGLVKTSVTWTSPSGNQAKLVWTIFAHRQHAHLGVVRLDVTPLKWSGPLNVDAFVDLRGIRRASEMSSQRWQDTVGNGAEVSITANKTNIKATVAFRMVPPSGLPASTVLNNTNQSGLRWSFSPMLNHKYTFVKYVGVATGGDYDLANPLDPSTNTSQQTNELARKVAINAQAGKYGSYDQILQSHQTAWQEVWNSDVIVDTQHVNLQLVIHAAQYILYSSLREGVRSSIAPAGLTSDNYAGHIFWDAETWMYPYLLAAHPEMAKAVIDYRWDTLPNAKKNVQSGAISGITTGGYFTWESSNSSWAADSAWDNQQQIHLQADIALSQFQYYQATGNKVWLENYGWPVLENIANYYMSRVVKNSDGKYGFVKVKAPDEYASGKYNEAYTLGSAVQAINLAIKTAKILGHQPPSIWEIVSKNMVAPLIDTDLNVHREYYGFDIKNNAKDQVKQADVVLLSYPMEYSMTPQLAINDLNYYSAITDRAGPAMTNSVETVIAAQYAQQSLDKLFVDSYQPYIRGPYRNFNETSSLAPTAGQGNPAYTFVTGAGGFMQTFLNGFAGYRFREDGIYLSPILPTGLIDQTDNAKLTQVYLKGLHWQGRTYDVNIGPFRTSLLITNGSAASVVTPDGTFTANPGVPLTIKTRAPIP